MPAWFIVLACILINALLGCIGWVIVSEHKHRRSAHLKIAGPGQACSLPGGPPRAGSMILAEERAYHTACFPPAGEWNRSNAESDGGWDTRYPLYNGHTWGCLNPAEDHPGACPEEGDWPDDNWPGNLPDLPPADPVLDEQGAGLVDTALALAADDPGNAGWTDQLLADLRDAPTSLDVVGGTVINELPPVGRAGAFPFAGRGTWGGADDCAKLEYPNLERLADTGEIALASLRAEYAAELRAQDDDAAEFRSRLASKAAEYKLTIHSL